MNRLLGGKLVILALMACALQAPASARRTLIDSDGDGNPVIKETFGYCDLDGLDCSAIPLGYTVDFGGGNVIDSFDYYGNGVIYFGANPPVPANLGSYTGNISFFGANVVAVDVDNTTVFDSGSADNPRPSTEVFNQDADLSVDTDGSYLVNFEQCVSTFSCSGQYSLKIKLVVGTKDAGGGIQIDTVGFPGFFDPKIAIGGVDFSPEEAESLFLPGDVTLGGISPSVPEPSSWATMIMGLGTIGAGMRLGRRRANRLLPAN